MVYCCIKKCSSDSGSKNKGEKVSMFNIPAIITNQDKRTEELTRQRQTLWLSRINRKDFGASWRGTSTARNLPRVCGKHFVSGRAAKLVDYTNVDWAPSLNLGYDFHVSASAAVARYERRRRRAVANTSAQAVQNIEGGVQPPDAMEFVSISEPAEAATIFKQEEDMENASSSSDAIFSAELETFDMEGMESSTALIIKEEVVEEDAVYDNILMEYHKVIQSNAELQSANTSLSVDNIEFRNTIAALVESNVELQNAKTALEADKQQLNNQIKELTVRVQTLERRGVVIQSLIDKNEKLSVTNEALTTKLASSEELLNKSSCSSYFLDDETRCKFYTGLPNKEMFTAILEETVKLVPTSQERFTLTPDQRLLMVLMKLKLNYHHEDIANRFHTSTHIVGRTLKIWLPCVAQVLASRVAWLSRDEINRSLPDCCKSSDFENTVCMFHCLELDTQKCSKPPVQVINGSKFFKKIKILLGIAPHGAITFVSEGLAGKVSDDEVAVHSGVLEKLQANDVVLVDYQYLGHQELTEKGIRLVIPSLKKQNGSRAELIHNTEVTQLMRCHIQRVTGQLKKFKVLSEVLSIFDVTQVGLIVKACAGIVNLRTPGMDPAVVVTPISRQRHLCLDDTIATVQYLENNHTSSEK